MTTNTGNEKFISEKSEIILFENTGVQFCDFLLDLSNDDEIGKFESNKFLLDTSDVNQNQPYDQRHVALCRKLKDLLGNDDSINADAKQYQNLVTQEEICESKTFYSIDLDSVLQAYEGKWFPLPFFKRLDDKHAFTPGGPINWVRGFFKKCVGEDNPDNKQKYHLVLAFDTQITENVDSDKLQLTPQQADVENNSSFTLCDDYKLINEFLNRTFVNEWTKQIWEGFAKKNEISRSQREKAESEMRYKCFYIVLLTLLKQPAFVHINDIKLGCFNKSSKERAIPVDLVLDVGNSRTCAMFRETHSGQNPFAFVYQLKIRSFEDPTVIYSDAFPSRVEFAVPSFANDLYCKQPEGVTSFQWASMVRTGFEAQHLSWALQGNEGLTGLSSPKRYLWDNTEEKSEWIINPSLTDGKQKLATSIPIADYIEDNGEAIFWEQGDSVFNPCYTRRSLMTFLLNEIIAHAYCTINSVCNRNTMPSKNAPRYIKSIIMTVPPGMPKQEIDIYKQCMKSAIGIYWKAMKWDTSDATECLFTSKTDIEAPEVLEKVWPVLPNLEVRWDEAICGQIVYLYNECATNFNSDFTQFFKLYSKNAQNNITIATVDIGGGTSDLVVNKFEVLVNEANSIVPTQLFRESFKVAGDDIMLDIINQFIIPSIVHHLKGLGLVEDFIVDVLSRKIGLTSQGTAQERNLKKILTLQLFEPLSLKILAEYERYGTDTFNPQRINNHTIRELLHERDIANEHLIHQKVDDYISAEFSEKLGNPFSILDVVLHVDFEKLHTSFATCKDFDICKKVFSCIGEVISAYHCDIVLITGRPSKFPGILACFRNCVGMPAERVIALHQYKIGEWYPLQRGGHITDPKSTASIGALICLLSKNLTNFHFKSRALDIKSCIKFLGQLDTDCTTLKNSNVFYENIYFDDD